jgi:hypothetical protein
VESNCAPVLLIIFNRPQLTKNVFAAIRQAKPSTLFIAADGPRSVEEKKLTDAARDLTENIDWDCNVYRNYASTNLGCKIRPSSAISWAFEQVESLIILEDDCLPAPSFFNFCSEMLSRYKDNERISSVSGTNLFSGQFDKKSSYFFSKIGGIWGWATWRRAWQNFDISLKAWANEQNRNVVKNFLANNQLYKHYSTNFYLAAKGDWDVWDYQWVFAQFLMQAYIVIPSFNLVQNIGFNSDATHTKAETNLSKNLIINSLVFPLQHQYSIENNDKYLRELSKLIVPVQSVKDKIKKWLSIEFKKRI